MLPIETKRSAASKEEEGKEEIFAEIVKAFDSQF